MSLTVEMCGTSKGLDGLNESKCKWLCKLWCCFLGYRPADALPDTLLGKASWTKHDLPQSRHIKLAFYTLPMRKELWGSLIPVQYTAILFGHSPFFSPSGPWRVLYVGKLFVCGNHRFLKFGTCRHCVISAQVRGWSRSAKRPTKAREAAAI